MRTNKRAKHMKSVEARVCPLLSTGTSSPPAHVALRTFWMHTRENSGGRGASVRRLQASHGLPISSPAPAVPLAGVCTLVSAMGERPHVGRARGRHTGTAVALQDSNALTRLGSCSPL